MIDNVCDVPVNEDIARSQARDFGRRNAAVAASNPKKLRRLLPDEAAEEVWLLRLRASRPVPVISKEIL